MSRWHWACERVSWRTHAYDTCAVLLVVPYLLFTHLYYRLRR